MKLCQSHVVAGVVALFVAIASCTISTVGIIQTYARKSVAPGSDFDPSGMVGHGPLVNQLLKLLAEVDGETGSQERLASARRVEKAILAIEAKTDRTWTEQGKQQLALIKYVRSALKEEFAEPAGKSSNLSDMAMLSTLFACGILGWAVTKWVNQRYTIFAQSRLSLKMKSSFLEDMDELDDSPTNHRKGSASPKALRKGSASPTTPKSKTRNARRQRTSTALQKETEIDPSCTLVTSSSPKLQSVSVDDPDNSSQEHAVILAPAAKSAECARLPEPVCECLEVSIVTDEQDYDNDCESDAARESIHVCFHTGWQRTEEDAELMAEPEVKHEQGDTAWLTNDVAEELEGVGCSAHMPMEKPNDAAEDGALSGPGEALLEEDNGCVYAPCSPGAPMQKFWPVLVNGGQFYTDGAQLFQMAYLPSVATMSETGKIDSDGSSTSDAEDGVSTAEDSDEFSWGVTMTRSYSEPAFPSQ